MNKINGDPALVELMSSIRDNNKLILGDKYDKIIPDYIESIKTESNKLNCPPARACMNILGMLKMNVKDAHILEGYYISALVEGLENGKLSG